MSSILIRRATPADAVALAQLRYAFRAELGDAVEDEEPFVARCRAWMEARLGDGSAWRCWVTEEDGAIVGHAWAQAVEKIPNPVRENEVHAYVTNLYVRPGLRGGGAGTRLLEAVLAWCRETGVDAVFLWPSARSRPLYLRHGFAVRDDLLELRLPPPEG
ncbi:MAG TPA: GNAT family N-acetyltransferase [Longimicrobium sp.]|nr:GNAT family N-acetyltransferase [Longimicrobium sp.]